jgi:uracil DNA glycosylase
MINREASRGSMAFTLSETLTSIPGQDSISLRLSSSFSDAQNKGVLPSWHQQTVSFNNSTLLGGIHHDYSHSVMMYTTKTRNLIATKCCNLTAATLRSWLLYIPLAILQVGANICKLLAVSYTS